MIISLTNPADPQILSAVSMPDQPSIGDIAEDGGDLEAHEAEEPSDMGEVHHPHVMGVARLDGASGSLLRAGTASLFAYRATVEAEIFHPARARVSAIL